MNRKVRSYWLLPITMVLWCNHFAHLSTPALVAIAGIFAVALAGDAARDRR